MPTDEKISQLPTGTVIFGNDIIPFTHGITGSVTPQTQQATVSVFAQQLGSLGYVPTGSNTLLNGTFAPSGTPASVLLDGGWLTSPTGTLIFNPIPQAFRNLELRISARTDRAATADGVNMKLNNDAGSKYSIYLVWHNFDSQSNDQAQNLAAPGTIAFASAANAPANEFGDYIVTINNYTLGRRHAFQSRGGQVIATGTTNMFIYDSIGSVNILEAITRIDLTPNLGTNFVSGTAWSLYGSR